MKQLTNFQKLRDKDQTEPIPKPDKRIHKALMSKCKKCLRSPYKNYKMCLYSIDCERGVISMLQSKPIKKEVIVTTQDDELNAGKKKLILKDSVLMRNVSALNVATSILALTRKLNLKTEGEIKMSTKPKKKEVKKVSVTELLKKKEAALKSGDSKLARTIRKQLRAQGYKISKQPGYEPGAALMKHLAKKKVKKTSKKNKK